MNIDLIVTDEAERDIAEAFSWYEERRAGLGEDFLSCLDASIQGLRRMPEMHPVAYKGYCTFRIGIQGPAGGPPRNRRPFSFPAPAQKP